MNEIRTKSGFPRSGALNTFTKGLKGIQILVNIVVNEGFIGTRCLFLPYFGRDGDNVNDGIRKYGGEGGLLENEVNCGAEAGWCC